MSKIFDIATLGTSLTAGTGATRSFHTDLQRALSAGKQSAVRTYNFGIGGGYTADGLGKVAEVIRLRPKAVTIEYTMNDCLIPLSTAQANALTMINQLKAGLPDSHFFLMILNKVVGSGASATQRAGVNTYNQMYRDLSVSQNIGLIDTWSAWSPATIADIPDGVHPTVEANIKYAIPEMVNVLSPYVS